MKDFILEVDLLFPRDVIMIIEFVILPSYFTYCLRYMQTYLNNNNVVVYNSITNTSSAYYLLVCVLEGVIILSNSLF